MTMANAPDPSADDRRFMSLEDEAEADDGLAATVFETAVSEPPMPAPPPGGHPLGGPLRQAAEAKDEDRFTRLVENVMHQPDAVVVALLAPFVGVSGGVGRVAAHGLLMLGEPALEALLAAMESPEPAARQQAAWALGSLRHARATDALLNAVAALDSPPALVETALGSLAESCDRGSVDPLMAFLRNPDYAAYRPGICRALGNIGDPRAVQRIAPLLVNPKAEVRLRAAEALIRLLDKRGWPVLFGLLRGDDTRGNSSVAALRGLGDLSSALAPFMGDDQYHTRRDAAELLGTFGDTRAVPPLLEALLDINHWVRASAAYALGRLGDRRALKPLLKLLSDNSGWVRQSAVRGLGLLGDRHAIKPLEGLLFDPDPEIAAAAQEALNLLTER